MDVVTLEQYEGLSPFEIKDFLAKAASKTASASAVAYLNAGRGNPNWIATEPREAFFLLGQFAIIESKRVMDLPPGVGGMPQARGVADRLAGWLKKHSDMPGADFLGALVPWAVTRIRVRRRQVRPRTGGLDHRRQLPRARPHAGAQRADRARIPAVGDVRLAAAEGQVQALRGRGRHRRDVLHLQDDEDQPAAECRRHDCARHADLHAVPRDAAPRGLRPQGREHPGEAGEPLPVRRCGAEEAARSGDQGVLPGESRQPERGGAQRQDDCEDRRDPEEASRPDPADGRCLRHVRAGIPLAAGRVPAQHDRRVLVQQVLRLHRLAPGRDRRARGQPVRQAGREAPGARADASSTSATARSRSSRASSRSSTASSPTAATWR